MSVENALLLPVITVGEEGSKASFWRGSKEEGWRRSPHKNLSTGISILIARTVSNKTGNGWERLE